MPREFTVISGKGDERQDYSIATLDERVFHFRNIVGSVCTDAQDVWAELWREFQGTVTDGHMVLPDAEAGFTPKCGWPEFLEKIWLMKHYIDYVQKLSEKGM